MAVSKTPQSPDTLPDLGQVFDVAVLGSGSAGLSAALACAEAGLKTLLIEKSARLGGTTAYSGAVTWIPANPHARAAGYDDSPEQALAYLRASAPEGWQARDDARWRAMAENAGKAIAFIERASPLAFDLVDGSDVYPNLPGGKARGRTLSPRFVSLSVLGGWAKHLNHSKFAQVLDYNETRAIAPLGLPLLKLTCAFPRMAWRRVTGQRAMGTALVTGLLAGFLRHGGQIVTGCRARALQLEAGRITGVSVERAGKTAEIQTRFGVVIATGGFEWNKEMLDAHFPGPNDYLASPRSNEGDGHLMAAAVGAELARMDQANLNGAVPFDPTEARAGLGWFHHLRPNAVIVDQTGQRFGNEVDQNFWTALDRRDDTGAPLHLPAWLITDARFLRQERLARWFARRSDGWLCKAATLEQLAQQIAVPADALTRTVADFNAACTGTTDDGFGRDPGADSMAPILKAPFVAVRNSRSFMSTKGGPMTDEHARVLDTKGAPMPGLYCAGVAMANPIGTRAVGSGTTIGPNMTWGYIAAQHIIATARQD